MEAGDNSFSGCASSDDLFAPDSEEVEDDQGQYPQQRKCTYSTYSLALAEARKGKRKKRVTYVLQTSDSSEEDDEPVYCSQKRKKTTSSDRAKPPPTPSTSTPHTSDVITTTPHRPAARQNSNMIKELRKNTALVEEIVQQLKGMQHRVEVIEEKLDSVSPSSSSSSSRSRSKPPKKVEIPRHVKRETKRVYHMLCLDDKDFNGWMIAPGVTYKSTANKAVVNSVVREVKGLNPEFKTEHIAGAAYTYYTSCCATESAARRGIAQVKLKQKRRHERLSRQ